jgi:hypothetical protein
MEGNRRSPNAVESGGSLSMAGGDEAPGSIPRLDRGGPALHLPDLPGILVQRVRTDVPLCTCACLK